MVLRDIVRLMWSYENQRMCLDTYRAEELSFLPYIDIVDADGIFYLSVCVIC